MLNLTDMRTRRKFDREFKQMVIELSNNRKDFALKYYDELTDMIKLLQGNKKTLK
jgi:GGDEF domain-containing protein